MMMMMMMMMSVYSTSDVLILMECTLFVCFTQIL